MTLKAACSQAPGDCVKYANRVLRLSRDSVV